jgi:hypothetical protein
MQQANRFPFRKSRIFFARRQEAKDGENNRTWENLLVGGGVRQGDERWINPR